MGILVIGPVFVDIKGYPTESYIPAGRNKGTVEIVHGGVSRNIVEDIANVELRPSFLSLVDDSAAGSEVLKKLENHKVDVNRVRSVKDGMGTWLAVFDNSGDVVASISKRPDLSPLIGILESEGDEIIAAADSVCVEIDMDKELVRRILDLAKKHGKKVFAVVSNMSIAIKRRDFFSEVECLVCNEQEAGILFSEDYTGRGTDEMQDIVLDKIVKAGIRSMVVTLGERGAVYASADGEKGWCPALRVEVRDTTGAGDAFFAGVSIGLSYGKTLAEACGIGTRLAASVLVSYENVCPRFQPQEFGLEV
ncbi:MAG: carbohydrate kinase family protein [Firmicutes bacterium]|nr:carbohydrate kinase family protein [Bacillota bacterium]